MSHRVDPYETYNFLVEIDGVPVAGFKEVSGLSSRIEVIEYREGNEAAAPVRKLPGKVAYSNVVLKTGITGDSALYAWHREWVTKPETAARRMVVVVLLDRAGQPQKRWLIRNAWPAVYVGPTFNAVAHQEAVQTFELAHEGIDVE